MTLGIVGLRKAVERSDVKSRFCHFAEIYVLSELYRGITLLRPENFIFPSNVKFNINVQGKLQ